jgi:hypothetical protein
MSRSQNSLASGMYRDRMYSDRQLPNSLKPKSKQYKEINMKIMSFKQFLEAKKNGTLNKKSPVSINANQQRESVSDIALQNSDFKNDSNTSQSDSQRN